MATAKLFSNGRSQAVRLPQEFRFEGEAVSIRRDGDAVILEALPASKTNSWAWLDDMPGDDLDPSFIAAVEELRDLDGEAGIDPSVLKAWK